jgi:recombinational DNA repair protein (RecF pathway)
MTPDPVDHCADCHVELPVVQHWSFYFQRPLCRTCYRAELSRPRKDAEIFVLEQLYALTRSDA